MLLLLERCFGLRIPFLIQYIALLFVQVAVVLEMGSIPVLEGAESCSVDGVASSLLPSNSHVAAWVRASETISQNPRWPLLMDPQTGKLSWRPPVLSSIVFPFPNCSAWNQASFLRSFQRFCLYPMKVFSLREPDFNPPCNTFLRMWSDNDPCLMTGSASLISSTRNLSLKVPWRICISWRWWSASNNPVRCCCTCCRESAGDRILWCSSHRQSQRQNPARRPDKGTYCNWLLMHLRVFSSACRKFPRIYCLSFQ